MTAAPSPVLTFGAWRTNGEMIADLARLHGFGDDWLTLDATYGEGLFWTTWRPRRLVASDLDPAKSPHPLGPLDATRLPSWWRRRFRLVVVDGPYKLNGTDQGEGARYGVAGQYRSVEARHQLLADMLTEAARVTAPGGFVLFKCQDQTNAGRKCWQSRIFADHGEALGLVHVDTLLFPAYRPQPARSTCLGCATKLMQRADGSWGDVKRTSRLDPFACQRPLLAPLARLGIVDHAPNPADIGQDASHVNYSTLLVFRRPDERAAA